MTELKPCPFCGGEAQIHVLSSKYEPNRRACFVDCKICGASSNVFSKKFDENEPLSDLFDYVIHEWNHRAPQEQKE